MSDSDTEGEVEVQSITRKRNRKEDEWKRAVNKKKRNSGEAHQTVKGEDVRKKNIGKPCKCKNKCFDRVGMEHINLVFDNYWKMASHDKQTAYLASRVSHEVMHDNETLTVCLQAFLSIHGLTDTRLRGAIKKKTSSGTLVPDQRGRHEPANKISEEIRELVREHIKSLKTVSSHYSRAKSPHKKYLPPGLNKVTLYDMYRDWIKKNNNKDKEVKQWLYEWIFDHEFNIGFEPPKSDSCNVCDRVNTELEGLDNDNSDDEDKIRELKEELAVHKGRANTGQKLLKDYTEEKNKPHIAVIAVDLQQTLPTPRLSSGIQYYKRKMWTYNLGIHSVKDLQGTMYVWNETQGKRGSCEIASCLDHYILNYIDPTVTKLMIFSDNCSGQNKNKNVILCCLRHIHSDRFKLIKHYFMVPGHSYLPCDRDFGIIEKKIRPISVYSTDHYIEIIRKAKKEKPFRVVEMTWEDFKDFERLQKCVSWGGMKDAGFSKARVLNYNAHYKDGFEVQELYGGLNTTQVSLVNKKKKEQIANLSLQPLEKKYPGPLLLSKEKTADLRDLMAYVLPAYKHFYLDILQAQQEGATGGVRGRGRCGAQDVDEDSDVDRLDDDFELPVPQ